MLLYNVRNNSQGFTMIETMVIIIIIAILSAIAAPSFLALFNRNKVNDALNQVRGALQESQRQAISKSKSCTVILDITKNQVTGSCLVTGTRTLANGVVMKTNVNSGSPAQITFSIRGNTTFTIASSATLPNDTSGKIILSNGSTSDNKCVALSKVIGIIRAGTYSGPIDSAANITDSGTCNSSL